MMQRAFNINDTANKSKIKLLKEKKIQLKSWWRQLKIPIIKSSNSKSSTARSATSSHTTLDWRSLSPDRPPLPFFLPDNHSPTSSTASIVQQEYNNNRSTHKSSSSSSSSSSTSNISINTNNNNVPTITTTTTSPTAIDYIDLTRNNNNSNNNSNNNKPIRTNTDERNYQPLCPILEESETMATDSSVSNVINSSSSRLSPSSLMQEEEGRISSESAGSSSIATEHRNLEKQPMSKSSIVVTDEEEDSQSVSSYHPPPITSTNTEDILPNTNATITQKTPSDKYMSDELVGDEERCKRKFAKMVLAANKFKTKQEKEARPTHMALLFDVNGNIDMMRMVRQGKSEYHKFCGNSQYVPPELSINTEYNSDSADIWVLGIFLYRMLIGRYPFNADNDQQLFKKMLHGNFSIPQELSEDAKDLLRRMLAPDMTRASLDLIIYHPWIKAYRPLLLDKYSTSSKATSSLINNTTAKNEYFSNITPKPQQQRNTTTRTINAHNSITTSITAISDSNDKTKLTKSADFSTTNDKKPTTSSSSANIGKRFIRKAILLLVQGPFPPPKKPYRDLSHLGTRESVFARQQQRV
ncbi:unnamed protein product [Mucor hiemalis]